MPTEEQRRAREAFLEIVQNQIEQNDPLEARITYKRLKNMGYSSSDAKKFIGSCFAVEFYNIVKYKQEFNLERYIKNLKNLPKEPFDDE